MTKNLASNLDLRLIDTVEDFKHIENEWNELYGSVENCTIFSSWDWMFTWWDVFQDESERKLYILGLYQHEKLVGLAPFQIEKTFPRSIIQGKTLRFIGSGEVYKDSIMSEFPDLIILPGYEESFITHITKFLSDNRSKWNHADFSYLLQDATILKCFTTKTDNITRQVDEYGVRHSIPSCENFNDYQDLLGKRWRKMYAKKSRLLSRDGEVKTITSDTKESIKPALALLSEMNCARWEDKSENCIFNSSKFYAFHTKILERLVPQEKAFIRTLMHDDKPLASYYAFEDKGQVHYYQSGFFAENANRYSPLFILVCNEIGVSIENKSKFDFMFDENPESYKHTQYATDTETMVTLMWSPQPIRLSVLNKLKYTKHKVDRIREKFKKSINTRTFK